jgi:hypothetical protein
MDHLRQLQNIIQATSREIMWINDCEEEELLYDWSDRNTNIAQKQEAFSVSPREPHVGDGRVCNHSVGRLSFSLGGEIVKNHSFLKAFQ